MAAACAAVRETRRSRYLVGSPARQAFRAHTALASRCMESLEVCVWRPRAVLCGCVRAGSRVAPGVLYVPVHADSLYLMLPAQPSLALADTDTRLQVDPTRIQQRTGTCSATACCAQLFTTLRLRFAGLEFSLVPDRRRVRARMHVPHDMYNHHTSCCCNMYNVPFCASCTFVAA